jgi:hypothetical protein
MQSARIETYLFNAKTLNLCTWEFIIALNECKINNGTIFSVDFRPRFSLGIKTKSCFISTMRHCDFAIAVSIVGNKIEDKKMGKK